MQPHRHCWCVPYFLRNQAENTSGAITKLELPLLSFKGRALGALFQVLRLQVWLFPKLSVQVVGQIPDLSEEFDGQFLEHVGKRRHFGNGTEPGPPEPSEDVGCRRP